MALTVAQPWRATAQCPPHTKTRLILLGTGGGPRPRKNSFASSQAIIVNNVAYVVDCGNGVRERVSVGPFDGGSDGDLEARAQIVDVLHPVMLHLGNGRRRSRLWSCRRGA